MLVPNDRKKIGLKNRGQKPIFGNILNLYFSRGRNSQKWIRIYFEFGTDLIHMNFKYVIFSSEFSISYDNDGIFIIFTFFCKKQVALCCILTNDLLCHA